jgi:hypothetical protein
MFLRTAQTVTLWTRRVKGGGQDVLSRTQRLQTLQFLEDQIDLRAMPGVVTDMVGKPTLTVFLDG